MECRIWRGHYFVSFFNQFGYVNFLPSLDVSLLGCKTTALKRDYTANLKYKYNERVYLPFDTLSSQVLTHSQFRQPYSTTG